MTTSSLQRLLGEVRKHLAGDHLKTLSDCDLLIRYSHGGEEAAFSILVRRHAAMVLGVCRRVLRHEQDAEDACQATFLALARKARSRRWQENVAPWLHRVAYRAALRLRRSAAQRSTLVDRSDERAEADPLAVVSGRELCAALDEELARLPEPCRAALVLCCLEGRTRDEAASQLGWPLGTLKRRLARGRQVLAQRLRRRGYTLPAVLAAGLVADGTTRAAALQKLTQTIERVASGFMKNTPQAVTSTRVVALCEALIRDAAPAKIKVLAAALLALCAAGAGLGLALQQTAGAVTEQQDADAQNTKLSHAATNVPEKPTQARDALGDPLPPGVISRLGTIRLQQGRGIGTVRFSPDGKTVAAASWNNDVRLWDRATGKEIRRFTHDKSQWLRFLAFTPDGRSLITAGEDRNVYVWNLVDGKVTRRLPFAPMSLGDMALAADGRTLALGGGDSLTLWDLEETKELRQFKAPACRLAFSADGKKIALSGEDVHLIDLATGKDIVLIKKRRPNSLAISPDGKTLATGDFDLSARLWDAVTGNMRYQLRNEEDMGIGLVDRGGYAAIVTFSPDGKLVASAGFGCPVRLWDVATGREVRHCQGRPDVISSLAFSADGTTLAAAGTRGMIQLFDTATGRESLPFDRPPDVGETALFLADSKTILTGNGGANARGFGNAVRLWDAATGRERRHFVCYRDWGQIKLSANGQIAVVADWPDTKVRLWHVPTGKELWIVPEESRFPMALDATGRRLVTTCKDLRTLCLWDVVTHKELQRFEGHRGTVLPIALSPDGTALVSGSIDVDGGDGTMRVWDAATGKERWQKSPRGFLSVRRFIFSPDSRILATVGRIPGAAAHRDVPGEVHLLDAASGNEISHFRGHAGGLSAGAFSADGRTLAVGGGDYTVSLFEVATGKERCILRGHEDYIASLSFSQDGRQLVSVGGNGIALVWNLAATPRKLSHEECETEWDALANDDAVKAYAAICRLAGSPSQAIPLLRERLRPSRAPDSNRIAKLLADLDAREFATRDAASKELAKLGSVVAPAIRGALQEQRSIEAERRLRQLLEIVEGWTPEQLRDWRALEVLERIASPEARQVLRSLAEGRSGQRLTEEAKASLGPRPLPSSAN